MCLLIRRGDGFIAVECNGFTAIVCYCSPNVRTGNFERFLEEIGSVIHDISVSRTDGFRTGFW